MTIDHEAAPARRAMIRNGLALIGAALVPDLIPAGIRAVAAPLASAGASDKVGHRVVAETEVVPVKVPAAPLTSPKVVRPELLRRALGSLERHGGSLAHRDRFAIVDFTASSSQPRFHFVDVASGRTTSLLVAHGSGSDPAHTGYLARFSNDFGSNASSEGAFATSDYYVGKHGRSQRLNGLDPTNNNALDRAIVVHAAWYANPEIIRTRGVLGRSQGCFAVGEQDLAQVFERLGPGRMIYSAKV